MNSQTPNFDAILNEFQMREFSQISPKQYFEDNLNFDFDQNQLLRTNGNRFLISQEKVKVDEKLKINKLRKIELDFLKEQQNINIINKRRQKFQQMTNFLKQKNMLSQKVKQENILKHDPQLQKYARNVRVKSQKNLYSQKILQGRVKAEQMRLTNAFRIQKKNQERLQRVKINKQEKEQNQKQKMDKVHLNQWNTHYNKLRQKLNQREASPPDNLYRKYKQKQTKLQTLVKKHYQQNKQKQNNQTAKKQLSKNSVQTQSLPSLLLSHRKTSKQDNDTKSLLKTQTNPIQKIHSVQYFGLYPNKTEKYGRLKFQHKYSHSNQLQNLKKFIVQNRSHADPLLDQRLIDRIQDYLYGEEEKQLAIIQQHTKKMQKAQKQIKQNIPSQSSIKYAKQSEKSKKQIIVNESAKEDKNHV